MCVQATELPVRFKREISILSGKLEDLSLFGKLSLFGSEGYEMLIYNNYYLDVVTKNDLGETGACRGVPFFGDALPDDVVVVVDNTMEGIRNEFLHVIHILDLGILGSRGLDAVSQDIEVAVWPLNVEMELHDEPIIIVT